MSWMLLWFFTFGLAIGFGIAWLRAQNEIYHLHRERDDLWDQLHGVNGR